MRHKCHSIVVRGIMGLTARDDSNCQSGEKKLFFRLHATMKAAVLLSLLGLLAIASAAVVDLTPENFDDYVNGEKHALVEFFAPWYVLSQFM
jgi:hypothetical protein